MDVVEFVSQLPPGNALETLLSPCAFPAEGSLANLDCSK
jgi:hypothetical protein